MKSRIYFLLPDLDTTRQVVSELLLARVEDRHIHVVAREGTPLEELPKANLLQTSDVVRAAERGAAAGGVTGLLAGLVAFSFPPAGLIFGGGAALVTTIMGAGFGAWAASLIGASLPNTELARFEEAIRAGQLLLLVDLPPGRMEEISATIRACHPQAEIADAAPGG